jgi:hypothetical protein
MPPVRILVSFYLAHAFYTTSLFRDDDIHSGYWGNSSSVVIHIHRQDSHYALAIGNSSSKPA